MDILKKGKVKGHYEHRNNKIIYVHPYRTRREKESVSLKMAKQQYVNGFNKKKQFQQRLISSLIFCLREIQMLPPREMTRFHKFVRSCGSLLKDNGDLDVALDFLLEVPDVVPSKLSDDSLKTIGTVDSVLAGLSADSPMGNVKYKLDKLRSYLEAKV